MSSEKPKKTGKPAGKPASKTEKTPAKGTSRAAPGKAAGKPAKTAAKTASKTAGASQTGAPAKGTSSRRASSRVAPQTGAKRVANESSHSSPIDWQAFVEQMEQSLQKEKSEIMENLIASNNDFKEIVEGMDPKDFADIASDDIDRKMIEALGSQELKRLKLIDSALTRIKQGKYGHCIKCNKRIPPDRLEAIPYALMCIDCKSDEERRNR